MADSEPEGFSHLVRKLRTRDELTSEEEEVLRASISEVRVQPAGSTVVQAGVPLTECTLLLEGVIARYKDLADGQRQIMELHLPGDFLDLHSFLLKRLDHQVGAMTPVRVAMVPHEAILRISESHPHLTRMLWLLTLLDAAIHRERILSVGRRSAVSRVAHLLCELYVRLGVVGLAGDLCFPLPLKQSDLGDATGLTSVHVNRMLKELRDDGLLTFRGRTVVIHDWKALQQVAEFSPAYLYLERTPR